MVRIYQVLAGTDKDYGSPTKGYTYSYAWFGYHTARSFLCLYQVNSSTGQYFWQAINVKSRMITDSRVSEASRRMFVKPLIIAQLYYPSSNVLVKSTYCKIHDRDWFQPRLDLHDSNAKPADVDWPIETIESLTDVLEDFEKLLRSHEGKCWQFFSTKAFLLVQVAVGWEAKQRACLHMHSGHRGPFRCSSHWETEIVPARSRVLSWSFLVKIGRLRHCRLWLCTATSDISRPPSLMIPDCRLFFCQPCPCRVFIPIVHASRMHAWPTHKNTILERLHVFDL